jgi:hypothetical protein
MFSLLTPVMLSFPGAPASGRLAGSDCAAALLHGVPRPHCGSRIVPMGEKRLSPPRPTSCERGSGAIPACLPRGFPPPGQPLSSGSVGVSGEALNTVGVPFLPRPFIVSLPGSRTPGEDEVEALRGGSRGSRRPSGGVSLGRLVWWSRRGLRAEWASLGRSASRMERRPR